MIVLLQKYSPFLSKKRTLIRRVREAVSEQFSKSFKSNGADLDRSVDLEIGACSSKEVTQNEAMRLFTKIPFPEPRRVIQLKSRDAE